MTLGRGGQAVDELANGLLALGVSKGDAFALLARTTLEWSLFDFALALVGAVGAPIYSNSSARDVQYVLEHSEAVGVLVEDDDQRAKVDGLRRARALASPTSTRCASAAARTRPQHPGALDERADSIGEDDLFTFIYTSGTTGPPKACMIRHRNYYAMVQKGDEMEERLTEPGDVMLLYLPLAHNYGRLLHLSAAYVGYTIAFLPDPLRAAEELPRVRPKIFPSVPRVYEKIHTAVVAKFEEETGVQRALDRLGARVGYRVSKLRQAKQPVPRALALQHRIANRLVYSKVKARLGGRLRVANAGGAPLSRDIAEFFHAIDILDPRGLRPLRGDDRRDRQPPDDFKFGTVGKALPGVEIGSPKTARSSLRSNTVFAGYYHDERRPRGARRRRLRAHRRRRPHRRGRVPRDHRPQEGHHRHRRRQERRAAEPRERAEVARVVSQAIVVGDRKPYIAALITLDPEATRNGARRARRCRPRRRRERANAHATSRSSASRCSRATSGSSTTRSRRR